MSQIITIGAGVSVSSMVYSNSGDYLSAGLCTGEVGMFESDSGRLLTIGRPLSQSEVTMRISVPLKKLL